MGGWVKWEKDLETDPRFVRLVRKMRDTCHAGALQASAATSLAMGCLLRLWSYADTHIRTDNTLDLGTADIDDLVGVPGFAVSLPEDWLRLIDDGTVELPQYQEHNGVEAKKKDLAQKRQERKRSRDRHAAVTNERDASVTSALPDQTRPDQKNNPPTPHGGLNGHTAARSRTPERLRKDASRAAWIKSEIARKANDFEGLRQREPLIAEAVRLFGGFHAIGMTQTDRMPQARSRFRELYEQLLEHSASEER